MNTSDVKRYYRFLGHKKQTELRVIKINHKGAVPSVFCNSKEEFIKACKKYDGNHQVYAGINERCLNGKNDNDVEYFTNIGHDVDCHKDNSSLETAKRVCFKYCEDVVKQGLEEPMIIFSGSGYWILHHVEPIKNTPENRQKIKMFASYTKKQYEEEGIEFDSVVYNPSRIGRVAGTINLKNGNTSKILNKPSGIPCKKFRDQINSMKLPKFENTKVADIPKGKCAFMNYCLSHKLPSGNRHNIISKNLAIYISDRLDKEKLKQQYIQIQEMDNRDLDGWLNTIKNHPNFCCGELIKYQFENNIPLQCENCPLFKKKEEGLGEVRGWAKSMSIIKFAEKHNFTKCPKCNNDFMFTESHGFYECKECNYRGGLTKFAELILSEKSEELTKLKTEEIQNEKL